MGFMLPYAFDTSRVVRLILRGVVGFELLVIVPGIAFSIAASRGIVAVLLLITCGAFLLAFGWIVGRFLDASTGTISAESIVVEPMKFCGIQLPGPSGTIPIARFKAVRVVRVAARTDTTSSTGPSTRVYLVGQNGAADLLIARAGVDEGSALGRDLSAALHLPREDSSAPY